MLRFAYLGLVASAACASAGRDGIAVGPDAAQPGSGLDGSTGGSGSDAATAREGKLLLTEIALAPSTNEMIEITNPSAQPIDLGHYYLSDNGNYFMLPGGVPTVTSGDFIVQFPAGATIDGHAVITVAIGTSAAFSTAYGVAPTYSIADGTLTKIATTNTPSLTDTGEMVALFQWDGASPLVHDVDIMMAGAPTATNRLVDKSGHAMGGASYAPDADSMPMQSSAPPAGMSTKRIALDGGHETAAGTGNGITGDDETSELTSMTWDTAFTAPTPGTVPAALQ